MRRGFAERPAFCSGSRGDGSRRRGGLRVPRLTAAAGGATNPKLAAPTLITRHHSSVRWGLRLVSFRDYVEACGGWENGNVVDQSTTPQPSELAGGPTNLKPCSEAISIAPERMVQKSVDGIHNSARRPAVPPCAPAVARGWPLCRAARPSSGALNGPRPDFGAAAALPSHAKRPRASVVTLKYVASQAPSAIVDVRDTTVAAHNELSMRPRTAARGREQLTSGRCIRLPPR